MCERCLLLLVLLLQHEDALAQAAFEETRRRNRDFEDRDRSHREDLEVCVFPPEASDLMIDSHRPAEPARPTVTSSTHAEPHTRLLTDC